MRENWKCDTNLTATLNDFKLKLQAWRKDTFGNVFQRKKRNTLRLERVGMALERRVTEAMLWSERMLRQERQELLLQEELLWLQTSRNNSLKHSNGNKILP